MTLADGHWHGPQIGAPCPRASCDGVLGVLNTKINRDENRRIQYLGCRKCGCRPDKNIRVVPLHYAPPRS